MSKAKLISVSDALADVKEVCAKFGLGDDQLFWFESAVTNSKPILQDDRYYIDIKVYESLLRNFMVACQEKDLSMLTRPRGFKTKPVDIEEFLESKEFLAQKGFVRPIIKKELINICDNLDTYNEIVLSGGVGLGKSYLSRILISYLVYRDSCLLDPQSEFSLAPGSSILYIIQAVSLNIAKRAVFGELRTLLKGSPYFTKVFPFNKRIESELRFPKSLTILPVSGSEMAGLGLNVKAVHMTECNYMSVTENSKLSVNKEDNIYDQADRNYTILSQRMRSRFGNNGKIILDSAVNYPGDFLDRKVQEAKTNPTIYVMKYAHWEVLPRGSVSEETFLVEVGTAEYNSRILVSLDEAHPGSQVLEVPMDYLHDFKRNCETALRDFAGIAVATEGNFITDRSKVTKAIQAHTLAYGKHQLFTKDDIIIDAELEPSNPDFGRLINQDYLKEPSFDETDTFVMHMDLGISKDATGIAIGHIQDYVEMPSTTRYSDSKGTFMDLSDLRMPVICLDGLLRVRPPHGGQVHLDLLRGFLYYICQVINIKICTADSFESTNFIQGLLRLKVRAGKRSTVTTPVPFLEWKQAYMEERIMHPAHEGYLDELFNLQYDPSRNKIDHMPGGRKDITDAAAIVVNILTHKVAILSRKETSKQKIEYEKPLVRKIRFGGKRRLGR